MRHGAVTAVVGLSACATWTVLPCLADGHTLGVALLIAAPSALVGSFALVTPRAWLQRVAFPVTLASAHFFVGPQAPTTIIAQLATLTAWLALAGRAWDASASHAPPASSAWRALPPLSLAKRPTTHAFLAMALVVAPSIGAWAQPDIEALALASFGDLGPLALVGASLLATCVGLAFAADLLEGRAARRRNIGSIRRRALAAVCTLGVGAAVRVARAWG